MAIELKEQGAYKWMSFNEQLLIYNTMNWEGWREKPFFCYAWFSRNYQLRRNWVVVCKPQYDEVSSNSTYKKLKHFCILISKSSNKQKL